MSRKRIVHISDPHFGVERNLLPTLLTQEINSIAPELVIISGDLTQRARVSEFKKCAAFISEFNAPTLIIPGNHDIPLLNPIARFLTPYRNYKKWISSQFYPTFVNETAAVLGINSVRTYRWKRGKVSNRQITEIRNFFNSVPDKCLKILVVHHNFLPKGPEAPSECLKNRGKFIDGIKDLNIDFILSGHLHSRMIEKLTQAFGSESAPIALQAGTSVSKRTRTEPNSFNLIEYDENNIYIIGYDFSDGRYRDNKEIVFTRK